MGKRAVKQDGTLGKYEFLTYNQVYKRVEALGYSLLENNLCPEIFEYSHNDRDFKLKMIGVFSKNCLEWLQIC